MTKKNVSDAITELDSDILDRYFLMKQSLAERRKPKNRAWILWTSLAACFLLIVGTVIVAPMWREDSPSVEPYIPTGEAWSPVISSNIKDVVMSADEISRAFDVRLDTTNQYTKMYAPSPEYFEIIPLPNAEYLPFYSIKGGAPSRRELNEFVRKYLDSATDLFGISTKEYEMREDGKTNGDVYYRAEVSEGKKGIRFSSINNYFRINGFDLSERRLEIKGEKVSILESDTDAQIREKLQDTVAYVCAIFDKNYSAVKISRAYSYKQLETITVYLYSPEETIFPSNFSQAPMASDFISLTFYTDWGKGTFCDWGGSGEEAFLSDISVYQTWKDWDDYYDVHAKASMLTLKEAEELLKKGYVFGGHSCPLCMAAQPEVDFSQYTCVDVEYVFDATGKIYIPFYAFYKYIGEDENGIGTYAKTYVPAVQVSGYEEYFESQKVNHRATYGVEDRLDDAS